MDIEDIINRVRYTSTASDSQRDFSIPRRSESREQSLQAEEDGDVPEPEPRRLPRHSYGHGQATHRPKHAHSAVQGRPEKTLESPRPLPVHTLAEQVSPRGNTVNGESTQRPTAYPFEWPAEAAYNTAWRHLSPVFVPATAIVPVYNPFLSHFAPQPTPPPPPPIPPPQQQLRSVNFQREDAAKSRSRGVPLPPLPDSLRRNTELKKKHMTPKSKKKRERHQRAVEEYDHLSTEEALQELAHRGIDTAHIQRTSTAARKTELIKLLQRADRNNNRGRGSSSSGSSGRIILKDGRAE